MVLVIESEAALRTLLGVNLKARGYYPLIASNVIQALEAVRRCQMVILDVTYTDRQAWDFLQKLEIYAPHLPVIVTTTTPDYVQPAFSHPNVRTVLVKPFAIETLVEALVAAGGQQALV
jgi:DNA-binding NtrC family response regulator